MLNVDRWLALYCFRPLRRVFSSAGRCRIPILMYHSISDDPELGVANYYQLCTSPAAFRQQMTFLNEHGYRTVDLDRLDTLNFVPNAQNDRLVAITFDDGFRDNLTEALPVLERFGFTATIYLATAYVREQRSSFKGRQCLTWSEVREMRDRKVRFGSHTVNHPVLHDLQWKHIESEVRDSKSLLEDRIQASITSFAYPYAFPQQDALYVRRFKFLLGESGYHSAVTTTIGCVRCGDDPLALRRLPVNTGDDLALFRAKLDGAYDWFALPQLFFKTIKHLRRHSREGRNGTCNGSVFCTYRR